MGPLKAAFRNLKDAIDDAGRKLSETAHEVAEKIFIHLDDIIKKVRGNDKIDGKPELLDGTNAPDLTGGRTNRVDRTTTELLYRGDDRPPSTIFDEGFQVWDASNNDYENFVRWNTPSNFVSTTRDPNLGWPKGYRYTVDAPGGIDADATFPDTPFGPDSPKPESEITFQGGIPSEYIVGGQSVDRSGNLGDWIPNPNYSGDQ